MRDELREFRAVVEYDGDDEAQLIYGPDLEEGAEGRARRAAKWFRGRDFEATSIYVESREVQPWETVVVHRTPDATPPHPPEDVANDPALTGVPESGAVDQHTQGDRT